MTNQPQLFRPSRPRRQIGRARRGLDATIKAMRLTGRLEPVDEALLALNRVAADELDAAVADTDESRYTRGVLLARYHSVLTHLIARPDGADTDGFLSDLFANVDDTTE